MGDKILDVTRWRQTHPGGEELLLAHGGEDCTNVFDAFHHPRVKRRLEEFQVGVLDASEKPPNNSPDASLRKLRSDIETRHGFDPRPCDFVIPVTRAIVCFFIGLSLLWREDASAFACTCGGACVGLFCQQSLLFAHDALHGTVFRSRRANFWTGWFFGPVCGGVGAAWWRRDHFRHHALTNVLGHDPSAGADPFVFIDRKQFEWRPRARWERAFLRLQPWTYGPLCVLFARPNLHLVSVAASPRPFVDGVGVAMYFFWCYGVFGGVACPGVAWFASHLVCSMLHLQLNAGHFTTGMWDRRTLREMGWFEYQLLTTRNIRTHTVLERWLHGGLESQIEHHLFPLLPRSRLLEVSREVQRIALNEDVAYESETFARESWNVWKHLLKVSLN